LQYASARVKQRASPASAASRALAAAQEDAMNERAPASKAKGRARASTGAGAGTFPVTFNVPGSVANQGVFAAIFGKAQFDAPPISKGSFVYLGPSGGPASTSTLSTTTTAGAAPVNGTPISVASVAGFPQNGGSILVMEAGFSMTVGYTRADSATNQFAGTTFPPGARGIGPKAIVTLPNVLGGTITVASTAGFASTGTLMIESPSDYEPNENVVVSYKGTTPTSFTNVTGYGDRQLPGGGTVIQMSDPSSTLGYVLAPSGQNLPLINLFPNGPYPDNNTPVSATLDLPDPTTYGVLSGVMVVSVGSAIALPVTGSSASPSVGSPTPGTNPNDIFGLFEWGITANNLDFDVSEVDQVGFPFQVTTVGASPPVPADPTLGVGMLRSRDHLFDGFTTFIGSLNFQPAAGAFLEGAPGNPAAPFPVNTRITAPQDIIGVFEGSPPVCLGALPTGPTIPPGNPITAYYAITALSASGESMASNIVMGSTGATQNQLLVSWQPYAYATSYNVYWSQSASLADAQLVARKVTNTSWTDTSPGSHAGNPATPPINNFSYDLLNQYLVPTIKDLFDYYRPPNPRSPTTTFVLDDLATSTKWTGYTQDVYVSGNSGPFYTMLSLTGSGGQWGNKFAGKTLNIYQPLFADNTDDATYPPAPSWLTAAYSAAESPSSMVFGADGVFGSVIDPLSTLDAADAKNLYNDIVSALNRGITPRRVGGPWCVLPPTYWANSPLLESAKPVLRTAGHVPPGRYRYAITAVSIDGTVLTGTVTGATATNPIQISSANHGLQTGDRVIISGVVGNTSANGTFPVTVIDANTFSIPVRANGYYSGGGTWSQATETTPSNVIEVDVGGSQNSVALSWAAINPPGGPTGAGTAAGFNIYRSQLSNGSWTSPMKVNALPIANGPGEPTTKYFDEAATAPYGSPPFVYYDGSTRSNFYAAYFSQLDVSINGLGYGFPYADKNGQSTNVQMSLPGPTGLTITLLPWTASS
jgi:hypothetical protein